MIIKRIFFEKSIYDQNDIKIKNILIKYKLLDTRSGTKKYIDKNGKNISYEICQTIDNVHKILCIYEERFTTIFYKTVGSGGNFLIDLISLCKNIGCIIDNISEGYINDIIIRLNEYKSIDIFEDIKKEIKSLGREKKEDREKEDREKEDREKEDRENIDRKLDIHELKTRRVVRRIVRKYMLDNFESLRRRGINKEVALFFKKKGLNDDVRWVLEKGL